MSEIHSSSFKLSRGSLATAAWLAGGALLGAVVFAATLIMQTPLGSTLGGFITRLFSADSAQTMWYITRAAGFTSYLLIWLSMVWGMAVSRKILDNLLHRSFTYDFHKFLSLLAIGFILLNMGILLFDNYLPYTVGQLLIPFISPFRPLWVGIGVIGFYLILLVTVTFYMRGRIGMKAFRAIHLFSLLSYVGVTIHGFCPAPIRRCRDRHVRGLIPGGGFHDRLLAADHEGQAACNGCARSAGQPGLMVCTRQGGASERRLFV